MLTYNPPPTKTIGVYGEPDELFEKAVKFVADTGMASASLIQRQFMIGYARAARLLDELEENGIVGPVNGAKPREILIPYKSRETNEIVVPKKEPAPVKVEFEETLAKWKKTKYVDKKTNRFEIELGEDEKGNTVSLDLDKYGNLLTIGSQFTSQIDLLNTILVKTLAKYSPDELRIIIIDGVRGDMIVPNQATHLLTPIIVEPEKSISALKWSVGEIERRSKLENQENVPKVLILINSLNQITYFSPAEVEDNLYRLIAQGRKYGFYFVIGTDYPNPRFSKLILANMPTKLVFKPTDKKIARETGVPESIELSSPDEAILETMFEGKRKITINKVSPKQIYEEIFG